MKALAEIPSPAGLSARTLSQILLIQNFVVHLPNRQSILSFVCRGLEAMPGAVGVRFRSMTSESAVPSPAGDDRKQETAFEVAFNGRRFGAILFRLSEPERFQPYIAYLENLCHMLGILFEERRQRRLSEQYKHELEQRVVARTQALEEEVKQRRRSQKLLDSIINNTGNIIYVKDLDGRFTLVNDQFCRLFELQREKVLGVSPREIFPEAIARQHLDNDRLIVEKRTPVSFNEHAVVAGRPHTYISTKFPLFDETGAVQAVGGISTDISAMKAVEQALLDSERQKRLALDAAALGTWQHDFADDTFLLDETAQAYFGVDRQTVSLADLTARVHPEDRARFAQIGRRMQAPSAEQQRSEIDYRVIHPDGAVRWLSVHFRDHFAADGPVRGPVSSYGTVRDVTGYKEAEAANAALRQQMIQVQKLEAIGTLAGGVAHDFNNLLMGIQGRASIMSFDLESTHPCQEHIEAIMDYTRSATDLTKQLLGIARGGRYEVKPVDINDVVTKSSAMFGRTKKEIRIHTKLHHPPPVASADPRQIEQVLLNLYINAWQAMPRGGDLYLETSIEDLDEAFCRPFDARPGPFVKIAVTDTGIGMDAETRQRIFDPFFTTREKERGTGLGLASVYGIVKNHGGIVTVDSALGQGADFTVYLRLSEGDVPRAAATRDNLVRQSATILLVDDEQMIRDVGRAMLVRMGFAILAAASGEEAIEIVRAKGDAIDLIILDMIMPGLDGGTTFDRLREIQPKLPVLLCSGYSKDGRAEEILGRGCNGFIQKPFSLSELSQKLSRLLP